MKRSGPLQRRTPLRRGKPLQRRTPLKRGGPLKRTGGLKRRRRRPETSAAKAARLHFNAVVTSEKCFFADVTEAGEPRRPGEAVTRRTARIYFDELDDDLIDECQRLDERYALPSRPSLLARLEIECPKREAALPASEGSSA